MKKKIAIISTVLAPGGSERNLINIINYINKKKDFQAEIILIRNNQEFRAQYSQSLKLAFKTHIILTKSTTSCRSVSAVEFIPVLWKAYKLIKKENYFLLIAGDHGTFLVTVIIAKLLGIKSVLTVINNIQSRLDRLGLLLRMLYFFAYKIAFDLADNCICVSGGLLYQIKKLFHVDRATLIYRGINLKYVNSKKKAKVPINIKKLARNSKIIIAFGRLIEQKNFRQLINIFPLIKVNQPKAKLFIIGRGEEKNNLKNQIKKMKLQKDICLIDEIENPLKYLKLGKIFVFPSNNEGFGNVLLEAMACGLPIISVDCHYGPREILSAKRVDYPVAVLKKITYTKYGILVPSVNLIVKAVNAALTNKERLKKYIKAGKRRVKDFSSKKTSQLYFNLIKKTLNL